MHFMVKANSIILVLVLTLVALQSKNLVFIYHFLHYQQDSFSDHYLTQLISMAQF
jgi:hypothetical protein